MRTRFLTDLHHSPAIKVAIEKHCCMLHLFLISFVLVNGSSNGCYSQLVTQAYQGSHLWPQNFSLNNSKFFSGLKILRPECHPLLLMA